jgi:tRNA-2-methylthio-N6-dimethylallyladenosine synthase
MQAADVILLNTCAIRENAEQKIWHRLAFLRSLRHPKATAASARHLALAGGALERGPVVGVLGCMAERLKVRLKPTSASPSRLPASFQV